VRELLQNDFDAVREKAARRRLQTHVPYPSDLKWEQRFGYQEKITLILRPDAHGHWQSLRAAGAFTHPSIVTGTTGSTPGNKCVSI
jgi:hypothetical protein